MKRTFLVEIEYNEPHDLCEDIRQGVALTTSLDCYVTDITATHAKERARVIDEVTAVLRGAQKRMKIDGEIVTIGGIIEAIEGLK